MSESPQVTQGMRSADGDEGQFLADAGFVTQVCGVQSVVDGAGAVMRLVFAALGLLRRADSANPNRAVYSQAIWPFMRGRPLSIYDHLPKSVNLGAGEDPTDISVPEMDMDVAACLDHDGWFVIAQVADFLDGAPFADFGIEDAQEVPFSRAPKRRAKPRELTAILGCCSNRRSAHSIGRRRRRRAVVFDVSDDITGIGIQDFNDTT